MLGPNTAGLVVPGEASVGIMPGFAKNIFQPGNIGVVSRSGSLGTLLALNLVTAGYGQSAFIGIGGDPILGTTTADAVRILDADPRTDAIVLVGEIGGTMEEDAAELIAEHRASRWCPSSPGRSAPPDRRMGHAGAIVTGQSRQRPVEGRRAEQGRRRGDRRPQPGGPGPAGLFSDADGHTGQHLTRSQRRSC